MNAAIGQIESAGGIKVVWDASRYLKETTELIAAKHTTRKGPEKRRISDARL